MNIYLDETVTRMCYTHRRMFALLAKQLLREGKFEKALNVVKRIEEVIPSSVVPHNYMGGSVDLAEVLLCLGSKVAGEAILNAVGNNVKEYLDWYLSLNTSRLLQSQYKYIRNLQELQAVVETLAISDEEKSFACQELLVKYIEMGKQRGVGVNM